MSLFRNRNKMIEDGLRKQLGDLEYKPSDSLWDRIGGELKQDGFEHKIQTKTDEFELIPYPETWGKIEAELPEERVSRPLFNRWSYALLLLLFIAGVYAGYLWQNTSQPEAMVLKQETITPERTVSSSPDKAADKVNNIGPAERIVKQAPVRLNTKKEEARADHQVATLHEHKRAKESSKALVVQPVDQSPKPVAHNENRKSNRPAKTLVKEASLVAVASGTGSDLPKEGSSRVVNDQTIKSPEPVMAETKNTPAIEVTSLPENQNSNTPTQTNSAEQAAAAAPTGNNSVTTDSLKTIVAQAPVITPSPPPVTGDISGEQLSRYSITVMAGVQYCFNRLVAPSSSNLDFSKNIALRESVEKPSLDWSGLFMVDYMINNHWRVSAGIGMLNFSQQFYYNITTPSNPPSSSEPGASTINTNDSIVTGNNYSTRIKYTWTEIPLLVTYSFNHKNKFGFELQGGFSYAMISSVDAGMISYDNIGVLVLKDKSDFPVIKNNFFVQLNPALTYRINNQITLSVMPTFKYSLNSMISNENWVQQYPYFFGGSISLRRRF